MFMIKYMIDSGRNDFHVKFMSRSYRIRGKAPRTQINRKAIIDVFIARIGPCKIKRFSDDKNKTVVKSLINKMFAYSAIKMRANPPALYSTLNPETNSDSPSAKSNGVRFVSARHEINQAVIRGRDVMTGQIHIVFARLNMLNE